MEFDFEYIYNEYETEITFLWNIIKENEYIRYYNLKNIACILKERIIIKNTYFFLNENKNYVNYNHKKILQLLFIMENSLIKTINYNINIDKSIVDLFSKNDNINI
tara:strand:+ start:633 stop:950 length:318 start_codon:yes stop_codon:yes gene_type:complete